MSARCDSTGQTIPENEVEPLCAVPLRDHGSLFLESASTFVLDTYGDTVDDAPPVAAGSSVSNLIEDDDD